MVTIKDISRECGVSPATVSKVFNGYSDVSSATVESVFAAAEKLGYTPNAAARALKTNHSNNIGVLFADEVSSGLMHEYFSAVLNSLKDEAERSGYDITFICKNIGGRNMSYLDHCRYRKCDGVVIACVDFFDSSILELIHSGIPIVTVDHIFDRCGAVISDNVKGMSDLVTYIIGQGHRRIAYIYGGDTSVTRNRLAGFYRACERHGIVVPDEYVLSGFYHDPDACARATEKLMELPEPPTCILYPDDIALLGGRNQLEMMGLSIPDDVSIAGYDGAVLSQAVRPTLTTLQQDTETLGREAARQVIEAIENPKTYLPRQELIPGKLLQGGTVKRLYETPATRVI